MLRFVSSLVMLLLAGTMIHAVKADLTGGPKKDEGYIRVEVKGILRTGIVAVGGETTGTTITNKSGTLELDFGKNQELRELAGKLDGKTVVATGHLTIRKGVEVRQRAIVHVTSLKAAK